MPSSRYRQEVYDTLTKAEDPNSITRQRFRLAFNFATFARGIPGYAELFSPIPDEFWTQDVATDGYTTAVVACPCGQEPAVEAGLTLACSCGRIYFFSGRGVLVANSPKRDLKPDPLGAEEAGALSAIEPETPAAS